MDNQQINVLGIMSGTSLDGVDFCLARWDTETYAFDFLETACIPYSAEWQKLLTKAPQLTGEALCGLNAKYGAFLGEVTRSFIANSSYPVDLIGSHGHTIFHQPERGFSLQIGNGPELHTRTGKPVVCDFRPQDVALGGQGAPLVPMGDALLFGEYAACLNLGGFANISFDKNGKRLAFDICAANMPLNALTRLLNKNYDDKGKLARSGKSIPTLLEKWNQLPYFAQQPPKSLGWEWCNEHFLVQIPELVQTHSIPDLLHTYCQHVAIQIGKILHKENLKNVLVTGGGAYNAFLIESIQNQTKTKLILPKKELIDYKEALLFGFLALRRLQNKTNVLAAVTGAKQNHCAGIVYGKLPRVLRSIQAKGQDN